MKKFSMIRNFIRSRFFLLLCAVVFFASAFFIAGKKESDLDSTVVNFQDILYRKQDHAKKELSELSEKSQGWTYNKLFSEKPGYYESLFDREGLVFLIFENDTLRFWTDNTVAVNNRLSQNNFNDKIVKLANGWFEVVKFPTGKKQLFALVLLKREYACQNKYLANEFQKEFNIGAQVNIKIDTAKIGHQNKRSLTVLSRDVYEKEGQYLCTLIFPFARSGSLFVFYFVIILNLLGLIFALRFLQAACNSLLDRIGYGWSSFFFVFFVVVFRYLSIELNFPGVFYRTKLFSPELFGDASSVWLGSLGDLLINALLLFYLVHHCCNKNHHTKNENTSRGTEKAAILKWIFLFTLLLVFFLCSRIINYLFSGIISNSNIPFTLNDVFSQNIYTYLSLAVIGLFFLSYFLFLDKIAFVLHGIKSEKKNLFLVILSAILLFIVVSHLLGTDDLMLVLWPVLLFLLVLWVKKEQSAYPFSVIIVFLFIVSFFSAHVILEYANRKEQDSRKIFAQKFSAEQDPISEHLFTEVEGRISKDTVLIKLLERPYHKSKIPIVISADKAKKFTSQLVSKYFSGYWEKYEIKVSVFDTTCLPLIQGSSPDRDNLNYFEETIASKGIPTESKSFFYLMNSTGRISYLARIPLMRTNTITYRMADIFIEFDSRIISDEMGFPELMLDRKLGIVQDMLDYSNAKYKNGKLISSHGKFPYSFLSESYVPDSSAGKNFPRSSFSDIDGYNHLLYMADEHSLVVVSKRDEGRVVMATTFSYIFAFFSLILLLLIFLRMLILERRFRIDSFRSRIQYVLVSMVLFSLLFFGVGTIFYIDQQYDRQTQQNVRDKMLSALVEARQELGTETELKATKSDFFSYVLKRMSNIFLTDINLYDKEGNLVGSSQMKLFDEGLMSRKICPESYYRLAIKRDIGFMHDEKIGQLKYLSAYSSFRNDQGNLIGYLNIPYFARQSELEREISSILSAIINIYVLLFVISLILALVISEYFTKPLKLIQEKLSKIKLGMESERIEWKSQDEIGSLVNEYNRMIDELQMSAELLAKSERETAWREMAKQVAHEIKNPLTPMKLSIQHLQRTWKNKDDDMDVKIQRITETLIEQIEALSTIASEFSNFAKMPLTVNERTNMRSILENAISLFKGSSDTEIGFLSEVEEAAIYADKEQMLRVFNNLLKNALQAIPENRQGKIQVELAWKEESFLVKIKDNGTGINEEQISKIFTPNFTTKSGGMGLGLAMVKSIVETFNGKIWFETSRGIGTTFFVSIPEYKGQRQ
ncbi:MAG: GHKL domain-containing protein [Bacteroidetes bacterium]|nr:GHKL domain-containing protein [Bacteroidota bacterium]